MNKPVSQRPLHSDVPAQPGDMVFSVDNHGRFIAWNEAAAETFGYSWEDVQGVPFDTLFPRHGSGPDRVRFDLDRVMAGTDFSGGFSCRRKGGARLEIYLFATAGRDETGGIVGAFCIGREVTAFWEAGQTIRASEAKFQTLFALSPDVIALFDARGRFLEVNEAGAALAGYSQAELAGMTVFDLVPPDVRGAAEAEFSRIRRRQHIHGVVDVRPRAGGRLKFEYRASLLRLEDQAQVLVVGRDATERLRAEERLRESEERFRAIFESARDGLFLETLDGRIVEANQRAAEMLGYRREQLLELNAGDLVPPETRAWLPQIVQTLLRDGRYQAESVNLHQSGAEIPVEISASLVEGAGGVAPLALIAVRDITGRRAARQRLRQSAESFRALAENANDGILIAAGPGRHVFANRRAAEIMGRTVEQLLGIGIADLAAPEELPALMDRYERRMRGEVVPSQYETRIVQPGGRKVPVELTAARTVWQGEPADLVVVRDVSERKRVEEELREMAEAAMGLVRLPPGADILEFAAQSLARLVPGAIVVSGAERVESVVGLPPGAEEQFLELMGRPLAGLEFERNDPAVVASLASGRLLEIPGGLCGALLGRYPEQACREVEDRLGTEGAFAIGLRRGDHVLGNVFILPRRGTRPDAGVVETFASQVSVALDRQQAEQAVRESERRLATLVANLPGIAYRCANDPDWTMEYVSQGSLALTGYRPDELTNNRVVSFGSLIHPGDRGLVWREVQAAVQQRESYELTYRLIDRDGRERWAWEQGQGVLDDAGKLVALEGFIADISARRQAETELVESREQFSSLFDRSPIGIYRSTPDGRILMANPALVRLLGFGSFEELASRNLEEAGFKLGYDRAEFRRRLEEEGEISGWEVTWTRADDSEIYVRENARLVCDDAGKPAYYEGTVEDLTERRRMETEVLQARERLRALQDNVPVGLFRTTPDGKLVTVNRAGVEMFGYGSAEEMQSAGVAALYADPAERQKLLEQMMSEGRLVNTEFRARRKDGTLFDGLLNVTVGNGEQGTSRWFDGAIQDISARKQAEAARRESEERFRRLFELSPDGIAVHQDGVIRMVNTAGARTLCYDNPEELVGTPVLDFVHPDDRAAVIARIKAVLEQGAPGELTRERFRCKDGSWIPVEVVNSPFIWEGRPAVQVVVRDITEREHAEAERQEVEQRYRQVVERALDGVVIVKNGRIVYTNPAAARMVGREPGNLEEGPFLDYIAPESRALVAEQYRRRMAGEDTPEVYEAAVLHKDGRSVEVEIRAAVVDHLGEPADLAFIRDISREKRHREELAESEERYRSLVEQAPDGIAVHQDGVIRMVNPAVARMLGFERPEDLVGRKVLDFVHPDDRAAVLERMRGALERGEPAAPQEERFVRSDGTTVWVEASAASFSWESQPAVRVVVRDIDRRKQAEDRAENNAAMFRAAIDFSPHGFAVILGGRVALVNRAWARALGCEDPQMLIGESYLDRVHPDDLPRAEEGPDSPKLAEGATVNETLRLRRRDGSYATIPALIHVGDWRGEPAMFVMARLAGR